MQWVTQVLKLPVVIKVSGPSSVELERLEEGELLCRGVSAQACVGKELLKARLRGRKPIWSDFRKFEPLSTTRNQLRLGITSMRNVLRSMSQDSINSPKNAAQISSETWNASPSTNPRLCSRTWSEFAPSSEPFGFVKLVKIERLGP